MFESSLGHSNPQRRRELLKRPRENRRCKNQVSPDLSLVREVSMRVGVRDFSLYLRPRRKGRPVYHARFHNDDGS
jgi:hypothetical protein